MAYETETAGELALAIVTRFLANQIDSGAVEPAAVARLVREAAQDVATAEPAFGLVADRRAEAIIGAMPDGWASGDPDWQEPA